MILDKKTEGHKYFRKSLVKPLPRVAVGLELSEFASSCIDISDGLAKDLKSIAISSKKGFQIDIGSIPTDQNLIRLSKVIYRRSAIRWR